MLLWICLHHFRWKLSTLDSTSLLLTSSASEHRSVAVCDDLTKDLLVIWLTKASLLIMRLIAPLIAKATKIFFHGNLNPTPKIFHLLRHQTSRRPTKLAVGERLVWKSFGWLYSNWLFLFLFFFSILSEWYKIKRILTRTSGVGREIFKWFLAIYWKMTWLNCFYRARK